MGKKASRLRRIIGLLVIAIGLSMLGLWRLKTHLASNKTKIIHQLELLQGGSVSFSSLDINLFDHFPSVHISLDSLLIVDTLYTQHNIPLVKLGKVHADLSLRSIFRQNIEVKTLILENGEINIFTDKSGYSNIKNLPAKKQPNQNTLPSQTGGLDIFPLGLEIQLVNTQISYVHIPNHKHLAGRIDELTLFVKKEDKRIISEVELDLFVKELAFNTTKGSFLSQSSLRGNMQLYWQGDSLYIPQAPLVINDQTFEVGAAIYPGQETSYTLYINSLQTDFDQTLSLLTPTIQEELTGYTVQGRFPATATIDGIIGPGHEPEIAVDFTIDQQAVFVNHVKLDTLSMKGFLHVGRKINHQPLGSIKENVQLEATEVAARYLACDIYTPILHMAFNEEEVKVRTHLNVKGHAQAISNWIASEQYRFDRGYFDLNARINGYVNSPEDMIVSSYADLFLRDIDIVYTPANVAFKFDQISLSKLAEDANFNLVSSYLNPLHDFSFSGQLENFPSLILDSYGKQTRGSADLRIEKISWRQFLNYFGTDGYLNSGKRKNAAEKKKNLKETIKGLYHNFQPEILAAIDTLEILGILNVTDFTTGFHFLDEHTLVLEQTTFYHNEGAVSLNARLDLSQPDHTPFELTMKAEHLNLRELLPRINYLDIKLLANLDSLPTDMNIFLEHKGVIIDTAGLVQAYNEGSITFDDGKSQTLKGDIQYTPTDKGLDTRVHIEGKPKLINTFFDSKEYLFQNGHFDVQFAYTAAVNKFDQQRLIREAKVNLSVTGSEIYYQPLDIVFPLEEMWVEKDQRDAQFKVRINIDSTESDLEFAGKFESLNAFLLDGEAAVFQVEANAYSSRLDWDDLKVLTQTGNRNERAKLEPVAIHETLREVLNTFHPIIQLRLDTFVYSPQFMLEELHSGLHLRDSNTLVLEKTGFTFHEGSMDVNAKIDIGNPHLLPFQVEMNTYDLDLGSMMESLDYLDIKTLQNTDKLEGRLSTRLEIASTLDADLQTLVSEDTEGTLYFSLRDIEVSGLEAMDAFASKIHKKRRFADLMFAPISNTLTLKGNTFKIPLMEVQANAIQLFLEGHYSIDDSSNIWVSIPLHNIKKPDLDTIPYKTGYALAGNKVYLEIKTSPEGEDELKFRTSKKKFYEERDMLSQFKIDKRNYRKLRKALKQNEPYWE